MLKRLQTSFRSPRKATDEEKQERKIRLFVCTFNMGNAQCDTFHNLVPLDGGTYDIFCFGMQESTFSPDALMSTTFRLSAGERISSFADEIVTPGIRHLKQSIHSVLGTDFYLVRFNDFSRILINVFNSNIRLNTIRELRCNFSSLPEPNYCQIFQTFRRVQKILGS